MWYAERQIRGGEGAAGEWVRIGAGPWPRQESAKGVCKAGLEVSRHNSHRLAYRIVREHSGAVEAVSTPPHGWRMRWTRPAS